MIASYVCMPQFESHRFVCRGVRVGGTRLIRANTGVTVRPNLPRL